MAADGMGERIALGSRTEGLTIAEMASRARRAGTVLADVPGERVVLVDLNSEAVPIALFGATLAGKPFVPINYRLTDEQLRDLVLRTAPATVICRGGGRRPPGSDPGDRDPRARCVPGAGGRSVGGRGRPLQWRSRQCRRPSLHQRHDRRAEGRGTPQPQPDLLRDLDRRVRRRRRGRGGHRQRAAVPHRRNLVGAVVDLLRAPGRPPRDVRAANLGRPGAGRVGDPRHGGPHHAQPHPRGDRRRRRWDPVVAVALVRRGADAAVGDRAGDGPAARCRTGQRLRAHRNGQHHRPAGTR